MSKLFYTLLSMFLITNFVVWLILTKYDLFNYILINVLLITKSILIKNLINNSLNPAFKIGLFSFIIVALLISLFTAMKCPSSLKDNYYLLIIISIFFSELITYKVVLSFNKIQ